MFFVSGRPHGVAPTNCLEVNEHQKSYYHTMKYACRGGPMWPPANITVSSYLSGFKPTDKLQFAYYIPSTFPQRTKREAMTTSLFLMRYKLYQYMPPIPPPMPPAAGASTLGSGLSATTDSVVRMTDAMEEAFCRAERVTLVGSTIPADIMST